MRGQVLFSVMLTVADSETQHPRNINFIRNPKSHFYPKGGGGYASLGSATGLSVHFHFELLLLNLLHQEVNFFSRGQVIKIIGSRYKVVFYMTFCFVCL